LSRNLYDHEGNWTCQTLLDQAQAADAFQFQADLSAKYNVVGGSFVPRDGGHELRHPRSGTGFQERAF
jgi:hypothetical protein